MGLLTLPHTSEEMGWETSAISSPRAHKWTIGHQPSSEMQKCILFSPISRVLILPPIDAKSGFKGCPTDPVSSQPSWLLLCWEREVRIGNLGQLCPRAFQNCLTHSQHIRNDWVMQDTVQLGQPWSGPEKAVSWPLGPPHSCNQPSAATKWWPKVVLYNKKT